MIGSKELKQLFTRLNCIKITASGLDQSVVFSRKPEICMVIIPRHKCQET